MKKTKLCAMVLAALLLCGAALPPALAEAATMTSPPGSGGDVTTLEPTGFIEPTPVPGGDVNTLEPTDVISPTPAETPLPTLEATPEPGEMESTPVPQETIDSEGAEEPPPIPEATPTDLPPKLEIAGPIRLMPQSDGRLAGEAAITAENVINLRITDAAPDSLKAEIQGNRLLVRLDMDAATGFLGGSVTLEAEAAVQGQTITAQAQVILGVMPRSAGSWTVYGLSGHAAAQGDKVSFSGHPKQPFTSLLFRDANDGDYRTLTFTLTEGLTDWHTIEGSGFVFNAHVSGDTLNAFAVLFGKEDVGFYRLTNVSLSAMPGRCFTGLPGVTRIRSVPRPVYSQGTSWILKLLVSPGSMSFYVYGNQDYTGGRTAVFDNIPITEQTGGSGYGPFASFVSHNCSVISTSNFEYFNLKISPNTPPQITAPDLTLNRGAAFSPLSGVTATDNEDGDLTGKVSVGSNPVDTAKPGVYPVKYQVSDILGATAVATRQVTVRADARFVVTDQNSGKPVPGAGVTLYDAKGAPVQALESDASGQTQAVVLDPGAYQWEMHRPHADYLPLLGRQSVTIDGTASSVWPMPIPVRLERKRYDLRLTLSVRPDSGKYGDQAEVTLTVTNQGNAPARPSGVQLTLPEGLDADPGDSWTLSGGKCGYTGMGLLAPGASDKAALGLRVSSALATEDLSVSAQISAVKDDSGKEVSDANPTDNQAKGSYSARNLYDMAVELQLPDGPYKYLDEIDCGLTITNRSNVPCRAAEIVLLLPESVNVLQASSWRLNPKKRTALYTQAAQLDPGKSEVLTLPLRVKDARAEGEIQLRGEIRKVEAVGGAQVEDSAPGDNAASLSRPLRNVYDLALDARILRIGQREPGVKAAAKFNDVVLYRLKIKNIGNQTVESGVLLTLPDGLALTAESREKLAETDRKGVYQLALDAIDPGKDSQVDLPLRAFSMRDELSAPLALEIPAELTAREDTKVADAKPDDNRKTVELTIRNAPVRLAMRDAMTGKPLAGAEIAITNKAGETVYTGVSNAQGIYEVRGLYPGAFTVRQVKAPVGYALPKQTWRFTKDEESEVSGQTEYENQPTALTVTTVDKRDQRPLAGCTVRLYAGEAAEGKPPVFEGVTNEAGQVTAYYLPCGEVSYTAVEAKSCPGYVLNPTPYVCKLLADGTVTGDTVIPKEKTRVVLTKVDGHRGGRLSGAGLDVFDGNGQLVTHALTNASGEVVLEGLFPSTYTVRETHAPDGFIRSKEEPRFSIDDTGKLSGQTELANQPSLVTLTVKDKTTGKPIAGAELEIVDARGHVVESGETDSRGEWELRYLPAGAYQFRQTRAVSGYVRNKESHAFALADESCEVSGETVMRLERVRLEIHKVDPDKRPLWGAEFGLFDQEGRLVRRARTDRAGNAVFELLPQGFYSCRETAAPWGYALAGDLIQVNIDDEYQNGPPYTVVNFKAVQTGAAGLPPWVWPVLLLSLAGAAGALLLLRRLRR